MARTRRSRGSISASRGTLRIYLYWRHPDNPLREHRWKIRTGEEDTPANRAALESRLSLITARIEGGAFFPCQEFPGSKIAAYCRCATCSVVEPLDHAHEAPRTLGELFNRYTQHEVQRSSGERKVIEASTWETKKKGMSALGKEFVFDGGADDGVLAYEPLTNYQINELNPMALRDWLQAFQHREQLLGKGKTPATTKYMNDLASIVRQALRFGQFQRWWRTHPMLEYKGGLLEITKGERNQAHNQLLNKPFTLVERDRILEWYRSQWIECPEKKYAGKEKIRLFFQYHYILIGFNTGLRSPSEMTALSWDQVDYGRQRLFVGTSREASGAIKDQITRDYTKTVKTRYVPINDLALESFRALEQYRQPEQDWIFWNPRAGTDNPLALANGWAPLTGEKRIRYQFEKCLTELKIRSLKAQGQYRMRHTFVTSVLDNTDLGDSEVAALIGDTVETMKRHYQGHCRNRWHNTDTRSKLNAINTVGKKKLKVVEN